MKFSILVPTHNIDKKLLKRCIMSINNQVTKYGQPYRDFEIIVSCDRKDFKLVNKITHSKTAVRKKITIVDEPNVSKSRNACLKEAQGDWIVWCDYDDYLQPFALETLEDNINKEQNCNCFCFKANILGKELSYTKQMVDNYIGSRYIPLLSSRLNNNMYKIPEVLWRKCISRKFLEDNKIVFDNTIVLYDDWYFHNIICYYLSDVYKIDKALYNYVVNDKGLSSNSEENNKRNYIFEVKAKVEEKLREAVPFYNTRFQVVRNSMNEYCIEFCRSV